MDNAENQDVELKNNEADDDMFIPTISNQTIDTNMTDKNTSTLVDTNILISFIKLFSMFS